MSLFSTEVDVIMLRVKVFRIIPEFRILKMLNWNNSNRFFLFIYAVSLKRIGHLNLKLLIRCRHTACFKIGIFKVQDF